MDLFAWKIGADIFCLMMFLIALWESLNSSALDLCENISDREVVESSCLIEFVEDFMKMIWVSKDKGFLESGLEGHLFFYQHFHKCG